MRRFYFTNIQSLGNMGFTMSEYINLSVVFT